MTALLGVYSFLLCIHMKNVEIMDIIIFRLKLYASLEWKVKNLSQYVKFATVGAFKIKME